MNHINVVDHAWEPRPPVLQARARQTRQRILTHAEHAFAEHGFHGTSLTSDILDPAGVSVGSFYHQFANKYEVLLAVFAERTTRRQTVGTLMLAPERTSFADVMRTTLVALLDDLDQRSDSWWVQYRERLSPDPSIRALLAVSWRDWDALMAEALQRWYSGTEQQVGLAGRVVMWLLAGVCQEYLIGSDADRVMIRAVGIDTMVQFCVSGVEGLFQSPVDDDCY